MMKLLIKMVLAVWFTTSVTAFDPNTIIAASNAIMAGTSVASTTMAALAGLNYGVVCGIEVENWTKYTLSNPSVDLGTGALVVPPTTILPGRKEGMVARKTNGPATGTYGTVTWRIDSDMDYPPRFAVVMWSVPFNMRFHSSYLGLALTNYQPGPYLFDHMYNGRPGALFARRAYVWTMSQLVYEDDHFEILGTMSTNYKAKVKIIVRPKSTNDLAESIKALFTN